MKTNFKSIVILIMMTLFTSSLFAQKKFTGKVIDSETGLVVAGATVIQKGTTNGAATDVNGNFSLTLSGKGSISISFIGYLSKIVNFDASSGKTNLGSIYLSPDAQSLEKVYITGSGLIDLVKDRQTPIASTTIKAQLIQEKLGNLEFPEILKGVPGVYSTNTGGYGDGSYTVRGFSQSNILVLINGQPVNDMEWGGVYWSNWSGLSDVASVIQQQRGLGSSKIGIPSVGGTTNIVVKAADKKKGGSLKMTTGNDGFMKTTASYNSGMNDNGWAVSALVSYWQGNGYMDATSGKGGTYFLSLGYKPSEEHSFNFTFTGAPQQHLQDYRESIETYEKYGYRYNSNWGYRDGKEFSFSTNFYHKPIANLNWDWKISDKVKLSTVVYGSWGYGGGTGTFGHPHYYAPKDKNGQIKVDDVVAANKGKKGVILSKDRRTGKLIDKAVPEWNATENGDSRNRYWNGKRVVTPKGGGTVLRSSMNNHSWYGMLSSLDIKLDDKWKLNTGIDLRTYNGKHYRLLNDLLGADAYYENIDVNTIGTFVSNGISKNPLKVQQMQNAQKLNRNFDANVRWAGLFGQLEYSDEYISAFVQGSVSNQYYQRYEFFEVPSSEASTGWSSIMGGNIKTGINWKINDKNNAFINAGYFSRQPFHASLYPFKYTSRANEIQNVDNEKITSLEGGYAYSSYFFNAILNVYYSKWSDRYVSFNADDAAGTRRRALTYIDEVHKGIELELNARPTDNLRLFGMLSYGKWLYGGTADAKLYDDLGKLIEGSDAKLYLDNVEVGGSPQFQTRLGATYNITKGLSIDADWFYNAENYSNINATKFTKKDKKNLKMPSYSTIDMGISYKLSFKDRKYLSFRLNVNNLFDTLYIARGYDNRDADKDASKNWKGINKKNQVEFGFGRTWNISATYTF